MTNGCKSIFQAAVLSSPFRMILPLDAESHTLVYGSPTPRKLRNKAGRFFWSALTCQRFGLRRHGTPRGLPAREPRKTPVIKYTQSNHGRDRSQPTKAVTGHRTPKSCRSLSCSLLSTESTQVPYPSAPLAFFVSRRACQTVCWNASSRCFRSRRVSPQFPGYSCRSRSIQVFPAHAA